MALPATAAPLSPRRPPRGGRGLKCRRSRSPPALHMSPPSRGGVAAPQAHRPKTSRSIGIRDEALLDSALESAFAGFGGQEVTGSSPAVSTKNEKSELLPLWECVRIFHLYQRYFLLLFKPGGRENPPGLSFYLHIGVRPFLPLPWLCRIIGGRSRRASRAPSRRLRNISPAPPAAGPAAATRAGTAPAAEGSGMHSRRYP